MYIDVHNGGETVQISNEVFQLLTENSVVADYSDTRRAIEKGQINFKALEKLADKAWIPLPLFFSPLPFVKSQISKKERKLIKHIRKDTLNIGSRQTIELSQIELILRDLIQKQHYVRQYAEDLSENTIRGLLKKPSERLEDDAARLLDALHLTHEEIRSSSNKNKALELILNRLGEQQILVSQSVQNYMPQQLRNIHFSGMTIDDTKVPYIFLAGGRENNSEEPVGRRIFTLILMTVLIARQQFQPVVWDASSIGADFGYVYNLTGTILMPKSEMNIDPDTNLDGIKHLADQFKVTPSAVTVRALHLRKLTYEQASRYLDELQQEFISRPTTHARAPQPAKAVLKYAGSETIKRLLPALDSKRLSLKEFLRVGCLNKLNRRQIGDLRGIIE